MQIVLVVVQRQRTRQGIRIDRAVGRHAVHLGLHRDRSGVVQGERVAVDVPRVDLDKHVKEAVRREPAGGQLLDGALGRRASQADAGRTYGGDPEQIQLSDLRVDRVFDPVAARLIRGSELEYSLAGQGEDAVAFAVQVPVCVGVDAHQYGDVELQVASRHAVDPVGIGIAGHGRIGRGCPDGLPRVQRDHISPGDRHRLVPAAWRDFANQIRPRRHVRKGVQPLLGDRIDARLAV